MSAIVRAADYRKAYEQFDWSVEAGRLSGDLNRSVNAFVECCGRHCGSEKTALRWQSESGVTSSMTFDALSTASARVANVLKDLGVGRGDVVAGLLPRTPELVILILGLWRIGAVYQPLFTAFGAKAIESRLLTGHTKLVVTNAHYRSRLDELTVCPLVATLNGEEDVPRHGDADWRILIESAEEHHDPVMLTGRDLMILLSTSGTTGTPKGVPVPIRALVSFATYMRLAVDLREQDVFWNIADPGWAYGLYYGVLGPLLLGRATTLNEQGFSVDGFYETVERFGITNLAGSPTAFRQLMAYGPEAAARIKGKLRVVSSAGEPLNAEVARWFDANLGVKVLDHYGQTETGMVVNNHHALEHPVREGSSGFAMPGYRVVVLDDEGREVGAGVSGGLAIDVAGSPLMWFTGYLGVDTPSLSGGYYRTGDAVRQLEDGSIGFIGRADDVITSSGYRIGPFDVESVLLEHDAVAEAVVIGVPDPQRTEVVKAFVVLKPGHQGSEGLAHELRKLVKSRLSAHAYPRAIEFVNSVPKTPSGKVQRFLLKATQSNVSGI